MNYPSQNWSTANAQSVGMNQSKVDKFLTKMETQGDHTDAIVIRNGMIIGSIGNPDRNSGWASAMKVWLSTLAVMMLQNGDIASLDEKIDFPGLIGKDKDITWRHLMHMTSGYMNAESPGTRFAYNDQAISLFITALRRRLGNNLTTAIKNYLPELHLASIGIVRSNGLSTASLYDYAKLLQLLLNRGNWNGKQLISSSIYKNAFGGIKTESISSSPDTRRGYLDIPYIGGGSNQTRSTGFGPEEYVFNGWINTKFRFGMPIDFFQANGNWGRAVAGYSPGMRLIVVVRIENYYPKPSKSITSGIVVNNLSILASAIQVECTNPLNPYLTAPMINMLLD